MLKLAWLYLSVYFLKALYCLFWPFIMVAGLLVMAEEWQEDRLIALRRRRVQGEPPLASDRA